MNKGKKKGRSVVAPTLALALPKLVTRPWGSLREPEISEGCRCPSVGPLRRDGGWDLV